MKQESIFDPIDLKGSKGNIPFRTVSLILLTVLAAAVLVMAISNVVPIRTPVTVSENFIQANPELRYARQAGAQVMKASFLISNPEARTVHLNPAALANASQGAFLAINPEARYAAHIIVDLGKIGISDFFEANPEVVFNQRYLDAGASR